MDASSTVNQNVNKSASLHFIQSIAKKLLCTLIICILAESVFLGGWFRVCNILQQRRPEAIEAAKTFFVSHSAYDP